MKKELLIAAIAVFGWTSVNAQETTNGGYAEGDLFISGAVGFDSQKIGETKTNGFEIAPRLGYFVSENIAVGIELGYQKSKSEDVFGVEMEDVSTFTFGVLGYSSVEPDGGESTNTFQLGLDMSDINFGIVYKF